MAKRYSHAVSISFAVLSDMRDGPRHDEILAAIKEIAKNDLVMRVLAENADIFNTTVSLEQEIEDDEWLK